MTKDRRYPRPMQGDTKPCPRCHGMLIFNRHCAVLAVGAPYQTGSEIGDRIRYAPAWACRNGGCDYLEPLIEEADRPR